MAERVSAFGRPIRLATSVNYPQPPSSGLISRGDYRDTLPGGGDFCQGIAEGAMQPPEFWRDLQAQFQELDDPGRNLCATKTRDGTWVVCGPDNDVQARALQDMFRALSTRAAVAAEILVENGSAVDAWLNHVTKVKSAYYHPVSTTTEIVGDDNMVSLEDGWIDCVCIASAICCGQLVTASFVAAEQGRRAEGLATSPSNAPSTSEDNDAREGTVTSSRAVFKRAGNRYWQVAYGGEHSNTVRGVKGMLWISHLLGSPRQTVSAYTVLVDPIKHDATDAPARMVDDVRHSDSKYCGLDASAPLRVDAMALLQYRAELVRIDAEIAELDTDVQPDRLAELREDKKSILEELERAKRPTRPPANRNRVRHTATKQYKNALKAIEKAGLKKLVAHLKASIKPGHQFEYTPNESVDWVIE